MKQTILFFIIFFSISCFAQKSIPKKTNTDLLIGFACFESGSESKSVENISNLFKTRKYDQIRKNLFSNNIAEKFLAAIVSEKLERKKMIVLNTNEKNQILKIKQSSEEVFVCSGCTYRDNISVKRLFETKNEYSFNDEIEEWLNRTIK